MTTNVDLKIGLSLTVGSIPVSLEAEIDQQADQTVYTFDGCVQDADLPIGAFLSYVGSQFGVDVQLPPELNLSAKIDYIAGQIVYTKPQTGAPTTQLGVAAQFELTVGHSVFILRFYADSIVGAGAPSYVIGASIEPAGKPLDFSNLPLVGDIPGFRELALTNIGFSYTNVDPATNPVSFQIPQVTSSPNPLYTRGDPDARNAHTYAITPPATAQKFKLDKKGFALTAGLVNRATQVQSDSFALPMTMPPAPQGKIPVPAPYYDKAPTSPPGSSVHWIKINKTFGPVNLQQIGLNYSQGEATFGLSAGFTLAGFSLDLEGLTVTFPLPLPGQPAGDSVSFDLAGLAFGIQTSTLTIGGALLKAVENGVTKYYGEVTVQVGSFGFKALGGYAPAHAGIPASFFLYVNVEVPLGGPPFLFVTGLAGGFGINRSLILPTLDTFPGYLLLPGRAPKAEGTPSETISKILPQMQSIFRDQPGEYWVAAGIQFTSFEMIDAFVLVTVAFGVDLQVGVIGTCAMTFPTGDPYPVAYVEIDILASFVASTGLLAVQGALSPASFLYGGFCKLSGGFAFDIWLSGSHKDEFVVTVGGYHPAFKRPDYYPVVPRLQMSLGLGPFQVTGQAYFALTPAMMMAGISMTAVWNSGPVRAWFDVGVDFLIAWAPFHYSADAYLTIGCSVNLGLFTLNVHAGATLTVWGPPFGGRAVVDLDVITFTIDFGSPQVPPPPVGWDTFKTNFLPEDSKSSSVSAFTVPGARRFVDARSTTLATTTNIVKASVRAGLDPKTASGYDWLVSADDFEILVVSAIPANGAEWALQNGMDAIPNTVASYNPSVVDVSNGPYLSLPAGTPTYSPTQVWNPTLDIGPMDQSQVKSTLTLRLMMHLDTDPSGEFSQAVTAVSIAPVLSASSASLWSPTEDSKALNAPPLLPCTLSGFAITPIPRKSHQVADIPLDELLFAQGFETGVTYQSQQVNPDFGVQSDVQPDGDLTISVSGDYTRRFTNESYILSSLAEPWVVSQRAAILTDLEANGFPTYSPSQIDINALATKTALVDWPVVHLLGAIL